MKKTLSRLPRVVRLAVLSAVLLALCSKSSPLYAFNDWMDANIFFTMGRSMLGGRVLYRDVFDHKGPVLYLLYGLAGLVGGTDFRGVLVLEIIAMTLFLYTALRTAELLAGRRLSVWWMALPAAGMAASRAFSHGGSAEELLLPFLAAALFSLVRALHSPGAKPLRAVCVQGLLAGCALWLKYTVLGFYLAWVVVLAALYLRRGWLTQLGLVPLVRLAEKTPAPVRTALPWAVLAACAAACYALTPNRALRGRARADLPQYRFAAQINGGSLLNYGTLDGGFYTAAGVLPPCKYFCVTNMPLDDQWTDQQAVLKAGAVDYVVALTGDLHGDFPQYAVIDRCSYDGGEGEVTWYLYQLQR